MDKNVLIAREVAALLRCHVSTIYRLLKDRQLPGAFKIGSDWRFNREQVVEMIRRQTDLFSNIQKATGDDHS